MDIDTSAMVDINEIKSSQMEYIDELLVLAERARDFMKAQEWCKKILEGKLDRGLGYILSVFYFRFEPISEDIPNHVWVIVGDIPPAYIVVDDNPNGACALSSYVSEMEIWVNHALNCESIADDIPVNAPPTKRNAEALRGRLEIIKKDILSEYIDEIRNGWGQ